MSAQAFEPNLQQWDAWRPAEVARILAAVEAPWYVAAGWAIDLFLGRQQREHEDIEIAVPRTRFREVADALAGFELFAAGVPSSGFVTSLELGGDRETHQTWVREPTTGRWRLDVFCEPSEGGTWIYRRDGRIRLPYDEVIEWTSGGVPYGRPEIVLLFKARQVREKDESDFAAVLPLLGPERRRWLVDALQLVHPRHRWLRELD